MYLLNIEYHNGIQYFITKPINMSQLKNISKRFKYIV